jgi:hypothetical protein
VHTLISGKVFLIGQKILSLLGRHSETSPKEEHMHTSGTFVMNKVILVNGKRRGKKNNKLDAEALVALQSNK